MKSLPCRPSIVSASVDPVTVSLPIDPMAFSIPSAAPRVYVIVRDETRTGAALIGLTALGGCLPETGTEHGMEPAGIDGARVPGTGVEPIPAPAARPPGALSPLAQVQALESSAALILFLARNPDSPEAGAARAALALRRTPDPAAVLARDAGADAGVVAAFDAAHLAGTAAARADFLAVHAGHPLAAEARFWMP